MTDGYDVIMNLTSADLNPADKDRVFKDFAQLLGWEPSDQLDPSPELEGISNGHLIVEHGLDYSAVITFLKIPAAALQPEQASKILSISYNSLIDWHVYVESNKVTYVFNRRYLTELVSHPLSRANLDNLKGTMFEQIAGTAPNPNFPALDDALVETISFWKRNIAAELNGRPLLSEYSILFNSLIFVRAVEDHAARSTGASTRVLLDEWSSQQPGICSIRRIIEASLRRLVSEQPSEFLDLTKLDVFDNLACGLVYELLTGFYQSRKVPYRYDFAIMSKHALSRIYEHYVSILRYDNDPRGQISFLPTVPLEESNKSYGSVYTPQFIARFFSRFLREQVPPSIFRRMKVIDPACGSAIFLRTILELQYASSYEGLSSADTKALFTNVTGVDRDENATQASRLSISLLYLVLMSGQLPANLQIVTSDALQYIADHPDAKGTYDAVFANPPFVAAEYQTDDTKQRIDHYLGDLGTGKTDTYLPFLKLAVELLKPGGFGLFVLPYTFLSNASASRIRKFIRDNTWIRCLVDLSTIPVFKDQGSYVLLFAFQKKTVAPRAESQVTDYEPGATLIKCREFVGHALQDYLEGKRGENDFYTIYDVAQSTFDDDIWKILNPSEDRLSRKLREYRLLSDFLDVKQGVVTGADSVFIVSRKEVPEGEELVWAPFLRDRDMQRYVVPRVPTQFVFYPIISGRRLTAKELQKDFKSTWKRILAHESELRLRRSANGKNWWEPSRTREPKVLFQSKIVTPHLILLPRFSLDISGKYAVSHAPYLIPKIQGVDSDILKFFLGVLNSTVGAWLISTHSARYSHGYARLEVATLNSIPVPDPANVSQNLLSNLLRSVELKLSGTKLAEPDRDIDRMVSELYGLDHQEQFLIGFEGNYGKTNPV